MCESVSAKKAGKCKREVTVKKKKNEEKREKRRKGREKGGIGSSPDCVYSVLYVLAEEEARSITGG